MATQRSLTVYRCIWEKLPDSLVPTEVAGRWNNKGDQVVYASQSRALAALEVLVHANDRQLLSRYKFIEISFPENLVQPITGTSFLMDIKKCQESGHEWYRSEQTCILRVPSVIVPKEHNYVINMEHPDINKVKVLGIELFHKFDPRLRSN